jgi:hypothetical protein
VRSRPGEVTSAARRRGEAQVLGDLLGDAEGGTFSSPSSLCSCAAAYLAGGDAMDARLRTGCGAAAADIECGCHEHECTHARAETPAARIGLPQTRFRPCLKREPSAPQRHPRTVFLSQADGESGSLGSVWEGGFIGRHHISAVGVGEEPVVPVHDRQLQIIPLHPPRE